MSNPYLDDPALRAAFVAESSEHLDAIERGLIELERLGHPAEDRLRALLRSAHTLKASARLFQLAVAADLAHRIEEALIGMQRGVVPVDHEQIGVLLRATDTLRLTMRLPADSAVADEPREEPPAAPRPPAEYVRVPAARLEALFHAVDAWSRGVRDERQHSERLAQLVAEASALRHQLLLYLGERTDPAAVAIREQSARLQMAAEALLRERRALLRALAERAADLQARASELHLRPLATITAPLGHALREEAARQGKEVRLTVVGEDVELNDHVLQGLAEPLTHLVRNAIDHGIEEPDERQRCGKPVRGTIAITTRVHAHTATIEVRDDGRGIDVVRIREEAVRRGLLTPAAAAVATDEELLAFIFRPGFSTRSTASETSGRGIGMDIVQERVTRLGGRIEVQTTPGRGTTFRLSIPLAAATTHVLIVQAGAVSYAIPTAVIHGVVLTPPPDLPVFALVPNATHGDTSRAAFFVLLGETRPAAALRVGAVIAETTAVLRPFNAALGHPPFVSGVALRADASVALVLDLAEVLTHGRSTEARRRALVAGDAAMRRWLRDLLSSHGWAVLGTAHGAQALAMAVTCIVDLVVAADDLPGLSGRALAAHLRSDRRTAHVPFVLVVEKAHAVPSQAWAGVTAMIQGTVEGRDELERLVATLGAPPCCSPCDQPR